MCRAENGKVLLASIRVLLPIAQRVFLLGVGDEDAAIEINGPLQVTREHRGVINAARV